VNDYTQLRSEGRDGKDLEGRDSKVAMLNKFARKKGGEVYKWFVQLHLVFQGKPHAYRYDEDKLAYALSYMSNAT
jgi:hypothetical protein